MKIIINHEESEHKIIVLSDNWYSRLFDGVKAPAKGDEDIPREPEFGDEYYRLGVALEIKELEQKLFDLREQETEALARILQLSLEYRQNDPA